MSTISVFDIFVLGEGLDPCWDVENPIVPPGSVSRSREDYAHSSPSPIPVVFYALGTVLRVTQNVLLWSFRVRVCFCFFGAEVFFEKLFDTPSYLIASMSFQL